MAYTKSAAISLVLAVVLVQGLLVINGVWQSGGSKTNLDNSTYNSPSGQLARLTAPSSTPKAEIGEEKLVKLQPASKTTFEMYQDLPMKYECEEAGNERHPCSNCMTVKPLMEYFKKAQLVSSTVPPDLYIVPMDHLARISPSSTTYLSRILDVLDALTKDQRYLHFGGSNHIFLCLSTGCKRLMKEVIERHYVGKDTRAMWVGVPVDTEGLRERWPCPDRVLNAPQALVESMRMASSGTMCRKPTSDALSLGLYKLLEMAAQKIKGKSRWKCSKKKWNVNREQFRGTPDTFTDTRIVKVAIVRDPAERFYSAYVDKIANKHEYFRLEHKWKNTVPSLDDVANYFLDFHKRGRIMDIDEHFRPMVYFGGLTNTRYDFVMTVPNLAEDVETMLKSIGLWDQYGASGWGVNGDLSFNEFKGKNLGKIPSVVAQYTPEALEKIHTIYADDYRHFGFPMLSHEEILGQQK